MIRVVYDTNVLVSGLLWKGPPHKLLRLVDDGRVFLCLNESMLQEFRDVIHRPLFVPHLERLGFDPADLFTLIVEKAHLFEDIDIPATIKGDPDDDHVLACALASHASFIVTGDKLLLNQKQFGRTRIIPPVMALRLLQEKGH